MQTLKTPCSRCKKCAKMRTLSVRCFGPISSPEHVGNRITGECVSSTGDFTTEVFYAIPCSHYVAEQVIPSETPSPCTCRFLRRKSHVHVSGGTSQNVADHLCLRRSEQLPTAHPAAKGQMSKRAMTYYYMNRRLKQFPVYNHSNLEEVVEEDEPCEELPVRQKDASVQVNLCVHQNLIGDLRKQLLDALDIVEELSEAKQMEARSTQYEYQSISVCPFNHVARLQAALENMRPRF